MADVDGGARVIVTGARGFIGRHLVAELLNAGAEVHGTTRASVTGREEGVQWWRCDLTAIEQVRRLLVDVRPDYVFHMSSLADGRRDRDLVLPIFQSEAISTVNMLTAASEVGIRRLVIPGSLEEPEAGEAPSSPYAAAKATSRAYAAMFNRLYGMPVVMTRIFMTYGPGQPGWKLIPATVRSLLRDETPVIASPDRRVDWIYVVDVVAGLMAALRAPGLEGKSVDLGSGELTEIREIVERLRTITSASVDASYDDAAPRENEQVRRANIAETRGLIGWVPRIGLDEGLRLTVAALRQAPAG